jgi:uncharacterized membrane protein HdeD (DUF308 family)
MENVTTSRLSPVPGLVIGGILLLVAVLRMPYGYYVFMRWFVTAACVYGAWYSSENGKDVWTWLLGAVAVLFNPILPFRMHRADWEVFNLIGAGVLFVGALVLRKGSWQVNRSV